MNGALNLNMLRGVHRGLREELRNSLILVQLLVKLKVVLGEVAHGLDVFFEARLVSVNLVLLGCKFCH